MKKMMIIAVMIGAMLIPAQMVANNKVNKKPRVEYNNKKKDFNKKENKRLNNSKAYNKKQNKPQGIIKMQAPRPTPLPPAKIVKKKKANKPAVVVINKPAPHPLPPPPAPVKVVYESNPVNAVASVIGLAALAAIIAN